MRAKRSIFDRAPTWVDSRLGFHRSGTHRCWRNRGKSVLLAPGEEFRNRAAIGAARVRVADVGNEEFPKARLRAVAGRGDKGGGAVGEGDDLVHADHLKRVAGE